MLSKAGTDVEVQVKDECERDSCDFECGTLQMYAERYLDASEMV